MTDRNWHYFVNLAMFSLVLLYNVHVVYRNQQTWQHNAQMNQQNEQLLRENQQIVAYNKRLVFNEQPRYWH